jgi:4-carboxymuconolactone decarboxylase
MTQQESVAWDFTHELEENCSVADRTFDLARECFGEQGIVELAAILGYYTMLAMVMNVARTEVGTTDVSPLEPFPS